ncbi:unnamed protein product [Auanema sp. JU1783]|nr:unnamed protein product [Auanema sp. JU1783]
MEVLAVRGVETLGGIIICFSTFIIFSTVRKHCNIPFFLIAFSYADFLTGLVLTFYGLKGSESSTDSKISTFESSTNFSDDFLDNLQVFMTISFAVSRLWLAIFPSSHTKGPKKFSELSIFSFILFVCICLTFLVRAYFSEILFMIHDYYFEESQTKKMVKIWIVKTKYFAAIIAFTVSCLTWVLLFIRMTKPSWSYNVLRSGNNHLSLSLLCLGRSFFFVASEAVSLEFLMEDYTLRLVMSRIFYLSSSTLLSLVCLVLFFPTFLKHLTEKYVVNANVPTIQISAEATASGKKMQESTSEVWSTGTYCIGQLDFEHHETRAERERSVSFYREVRGENDILFQKLKVAQQQREVEKEKRKISRRERNSNLLVVPKG